MLWTMIDLIKTPMLLLLFIVLVIIPLLFSVVFHELAHGYIAYKFGDMTPKLMGRLTLNPLAHLDKLGTILLLVVGLGWAKPVIINLKNIQNSTNQMLVALAGPVSNFLLAIVFTGIISILINDFSLSSKHIVIMFLNAVVRINIGLGLFNLIPVPPLDGSRIVSWLLPAEFENYYNRFEQFGFAIIMLIFFTVGFDWIFKLANLLQNHLYRLLGVI